MVHIQVAGHLQNEQQHRAFKCSQTGRNIVSRGFIERHYKKVLCGAWVC